MLAELSIAMTAEAGGTRDAPARETLRVSWSEVPAAEWETRGAEGIAYAKRLTRAALDRPIWEGLSDERRSFGEVMRSASGREGLRQGRPPAEIQKV